MRFEVNAFASISENTNAEVLRFVLRSVDFTQRHIERRAVWLMNFCELLHASLCSFAIAFAVKQLCSH